MIPPPPPLPETSCEASVPIMSEDKTPAATRGTMLRNQAVLCHQKLLPGGGPGYVSEFLQKGPEIGRGQGISEKLVTNQL